MDSVLATLVIATLRTVPHATFAFTKSTIYSIPKPEAADMQRLRKVATDCFPQNPDVAYSPANSAAAAICPTATTTSSTLDNSTGVACPAQAPNRQMEWHQLRAIMYAFAWGAAAEMAALISVPILFGTLPAAVVAAAGVLAGLGTGNIVYRRLHRDANRPDGAAVEPQAEAAKNEKARAERELERCICHAARRAKGLLDCCATPPAEHAAAFNCLCNMPPTVLEAQRCHTI
jgi:hypothetical protein